MSGPVYGAVYGSSGFVLPDPSGVSGSPQLDLCTVVAGVLDGKTFGGWTVHAKSTDLLPKYELDDLSDSTLTVDVVPAAEPFSVEQQTHGSILEDCPIVVSIEARCDVSRGDTAYRSMFQAVREIAVYLQSLNLTAAGFHGPFSNSIEDQPESVDTAGRFEGYVSLSYQAMTDL